MPLPVFAGPPPQAPLPPATQSSWVTYRAQINFGLAMLAYLERRQTLAALRATGWSRFDVLVFIVGGGLLISLPGVLLAAAGIALVGFVTGMSASALALPLEVATGTGLACGLLAIVGPAALALRSV